MRIGEGATPGPAETANSKVQNAESTREASRQGAPQGDIPSRDVVTIGQGRELLHLALQMGTASRQGRVEEVQAAVAAGTYQVSSREVSRAIVKDMFFAGYPEGPRE